MSVSDLERHRSKRLIIEEYPEIGYNFRMSDVHAALGLAQLEKLDRMLVQRRAIAARYGEALADEDRIEPPFVPEFAEPNFQSYIVRLRGADRDARNRLVESLGESGVAARPGLMAAHREAPYRDARKIGSLPHTEAATDQTLAIPMYSDLSEPDQARVASALRKAVASVLE
jgi:dTDP-4-amino-4,6-dideoxygalactose transaminase